jgi:uncharacterized protein YlaI
MAINLSYVKEKHSLWEASQRSALCVAICDRVKEVDNYEKLKFDNELLIFLCSCVENSVDKKDKNKINKKALVFEVLDKLFEMSSDDKSIISASIEFLHSNKLIKKVGTLKKYSRLASDFFFKR